MVHMGAAAIALTLCMWLASAATEKIDPGQPLADIKQHNPLHACLFACQSCSSEQTMLLCANKACLTQVAKGKVLNSLWKVFCPELDIFFSTKDENSV